jgi:hypothetical protein
MQRYVIVGIFFFLAACSPQAKLDDAVNVASGSVAGIKDSVQDTLRPAVQAVQSVKKRVNTVKTGFEKIGEGIELVGSGVTR